MTAINGYCKTNLDDYKREDWPTKFVAVPRVGDWVESKGGKILAVVKVTHRMVAGEPSIAVELHKGSGWA